jgi:circadian clock protein KaiC
MERPAPVATGVPQLDLILGGGIVPRSLMLIAGSPGAGKTVLSAQIACAAAARDERVLFITAFSEPHNKLINNLRGFDFFKQDYLGERIKLLNVQHQLLNSLTEAADTIVREAREYKAQVLVLDGFQGVLASSTSMAAPHQFLFDLSAKLSLLDVTTILTYDIAKLSDAARSEMTAVDSIIVLSQDLFGDQALRSLQVVKQRGANPLLGRHSFKISETGLQCYPRQESVSPVDNVTMSAERVAFGLAPLDTMLNGGLNSGTNTIIAGAEGVGKTLLGLHYAMNAVANGERVLLITFHETAQQLVVKGDIFGLDLQTPLKSGALQIQHYSSAELNADEIALNLREATRDGGIRRLVIDGLNEIERPLIERGRAHGFFASLITFLRTHQVTSCITLEIDPVVGRDLSFAGKNLSALADTILLMRRSETTGRPMYTLSVLKMRFSAHDRLSHEYAISSRGLDIEPRPLPAVRPRTRRDG